MKNFRGKSKKIISLLTLSGLLTSSAAYAAVMPNSGTVLEGAKPPTTQRQEEKQEPTVSVQDGQPSQKLDGEQKIFVRGFRFCGELLVAEQDLKKIISGEAGKEFTLRELNRLTDKLTQYLRQQGYPVAFAYIPAQDIQDGIVDIAIVPGKYGKIEVTGQAGIAPERLKAMLSAAQPGKIINSRELERALLLVNDLSGIAVQAALSPGETAGTADLTLKVTKTAGTSGVVYADNWGNRYSGQIRSGVQVSLNNPGKVGDQLNVGGLLTENNRMKDYNLSYSAPLGSSGAKITLGHSRVHYTLGEEFAALDASGEAVTDSLSLAYPLVRSRTFNLTGTLGYDHKKLTDDTNSATGSQRTSNQIHAALSGSFSDNWLGGGDNSFSLTQYGGNLSSNDQSANTASHFNKTVFTFARQQYVAQNLNFNFNFIGQCADGNLDSSEKLYLGGADGVRAFPQGEAAGDQGYRLTGEFRWRLPGLSKQPNTVYLTSFYDYGSVIMDKHPAAAGDNRRSLMDAGLGLLWTKNNDFSLRLDYAWKIGQERALSDQDKSGRFWLQGVKYF